MAKQKKNPYEGKGKLFVDGVSAEELGQAYVSAVVIDWFIRCMYKLKHGKLDYDALSHFEYTGIDCEKYRKKQMDVKEKVNTM